MATACLAPNVLRTSALDFEAAVFKHLPHIDEPNSSRLLDAQALELGKILSQHGLAAHVGICRLHKHFDVAQGEVVVARKETRSGVVAAVSVEPVSAASVAYIWALTNEGWSPVQFCTFDFPGNSTGTVASARNC